MDKGEGQQLNFQPFCLLPLPFAFLHGVNWKKRLEELNWC